MISEPVSEKLGTEKVSEPVSKKIWYRKKSRNRSRKMRGTCNLSGELWQNIWNIKNSHIICFLFSSSLHLCCDAMYHSITESNRVNDNDPSSHYLRVHLPISDHWPRVVKEFFNRFLETQSLTMFNICSVCIKSFWVSNDQAWRDVVFDVHKF